jgi:hypothetical protein
MTPRYNRKFIAVCYNPEVVQQEIRWKKVRDPQGVEEFGYFTVEINDRGDDLWVLSKRGKFDRPLKKFKEPKAARKQRVKELAALYAGGDYESQYGE